jgi:hypothetical protein
MKKRPAGARDFYCKNTGRMETPVVLGDASKVF